MTYWRVDRKPYVDLGLAGEPDGGSIYMLVGMLRTGNWISQYYSAYPFTHGAYHGLKQETQIGSIVRLAQRPDGFVSADASYSGGSFVTPPLSFQGKRLSLNMNASAMGEVQVEVQDERGKALEGYSFADADPLHQNSLSQIVSWGGKPDISSLAGKTIRLAFRMRSVKLYAFQFSE